MLGTLPLRGTSSQSQKRTRCGGFFSMSFGVVMTVSMNWIDTLAQVLKKSALKKREIKQTCKQKKTTFLMFQWVQCPVSTYRGVQTCEKKKYDKKIQMVSMSVFKIKQMCQLPPLTVEFPWGVVWGLKVATRCAVDKSWHKIGRQTVNGRELTNLSSLFDSTSRFKQNLTTTSMCHTCDKWTGQSLFLWDWDSNLCLSFLKVVLVNWTSNLHGPNKTWGRLGFDAWLGNTSVRASLHAPTGESLWNGSLVFKSSSEPLELLLKVEISPQISKTHSGIRVRVDRTTMIGWSLNPVWIQIYTHMTSTGNHKDTRARAWGLMSSVIVKTTACGVHGWGSYLHLSSFNDSCKLTHTKVEICAP